MKQFSGVFTALVTPFKDGNIDWSSLRRLLRSQLDSGIEGFVVNGTTAESPTLLDSERRKLFEFVRAETGRQVPLVMGTGSNSTLKTCLETKEAADLGADAALVVVPYYNKPSQRGLFQHYQKIAEASLLPIILYNVPSRTITKLELETIAELSRLPGIIGIKEATGDIEFGRQIVEATPPEFVLTSGDDASFLNLIGAGGQGVIGVGSHILGKLFVESCRRMRAGDLGAKADFADRADLIACLYTEANPIPVKMALYLMGIIDSPELRLPLTTHSEPLAAGLKKKLSDAGLI